MQPFGTFFSIASSYVRTEATPHGATTARNSMGIRWGNATKTLNDSVRIIGSVERCKRLKCLVQGLSGGPTTFSPVLQQEIGGVQQGVFQCCDQHSVASASAIGINEEAGIGNRGAVGGEAS